MGFFSFLIVFVLGHSLRVYAHVRLLWFPPFLTTLMFCTIRNANQKILLVGFCRSWQAGWLSMDSCIPATVVLLISWIARHHCHHRSCVLLKLFLNVDRCIRTLFGVGERLL